MDMRDLAPGEHATGQTADRLSRATVVAGHHLQAVESDLVQMDGLLDAAIHKLSASFLAIHETAARQQTLLQRLADDRCPADECAAALRAMHDDIEQHLAAAVTGLQFHDITSQLIRRMASHVGGAREVLDTLDAHAAALDAQGHAAHLSALAPLRARIAAHGVALAAHSPRKVGQQHMESGDIELF